MQSRCHSCLSMIGSGIALTTPGRAHLAQCATWPCWPTGARPQPGGRAFVFLQHARPRPYAPPCMGVQAPRLPRVPRALFAGSGTTNGSFCPRDPNTIRPRFCCYRLAKWLADHTLLAAADRRSPPSGGISTAAEGEASAQGCLRVRAQTMLCRPRTCSHGDAEPPHGQHRHSDAARPR